MANKLGLQASSEVTLPFEDTDDIPDWALSAVKAVYEAGYLTGVGGADGKLYFNSDSPITRAEAMTLIGRTMTELDENAPLDFTDADEIPQWAVIYMRTLAAKGIINGYDGKIMPLANITRAEVAKIMATM